MHHECFLAIKSLGANKNILITKPDKSSGMVILNYTDYMEKMELILNDTDKFQCLGLDEEKDDTAKIGTKLQKCLQQLKKMT